MDENGINPFVIIIVLNLNKYGMYVCYIQILL